MPLDDPLAALRERIDAVDEHIQSLLNERAGLVLEIADVKRAQGQGGAIYRPEREAQILRRVSTRNAGPLPDAALAGLFREIMSVCRALEQSHAVAYLGPEGTYSEMAAQKHFGQAVRALPVGSIEEVFRCVESDAAQYGVVPVENSSEGVVNLTLDCLMQSTLTLSGEIYLRVQHNLLTQAKSLAAIARIYAHPQALAQCREWLGAHLSHAERVPVVSNGEAAKRAQAEPDHAAALGSARAAERWGLGILAEHIEDRPDNTTRFAVIGRIPAPASGADKTSLLLASANRPGALVRLLEPLSRHGISMTRIESRPSRRGVWDYVFFIDIDGHASDSAVAAALQQIERDAVMLKVLGSYPAAVN